MIFLARILLSTLFINTAFADSLPSQNKLHLWEVSKDGSSDYIFGSVHLCVGVSDLSPLVMELHNHSDTHVYEMIPRPPDSMFDFGSSADLSALQQLHLTTAEFETRSYVNKNPIPVEYYGKLARIGIPRAFHRFISDDALTPVIGAECIFRRPYKSIDHELMVNSTVTKKKVIELENKEIRETAEALLGGPLFVSDLLEYYSDEDIKEIQLSILDVAHEYLTGEISPDDLTDSDDGDMIFRNKHWMTQLPAIFLKEKAFVTVGAGHLYGKNGILKRLEKEGFKLKRILD